MNWFFIYAGGIVLLLLVELGLRLHVDKYAAPLLAWYRQAAPQGGQIPEPCCTAVLPPRFVGPPAIYCWSDSCKNHSGIPYSRIRWPDTWAAGRTWPF